MITVRELMSASPQTITDGETIGEASERMKRAHVRHLPVIANGALVGLLSDQDVRVAEALGRHDARVRDAMSHAPYAVEVSADLTGVVAAMAEKKLGSAVVVDRGEVVGIFTTTDALHLLVQHLGVDVLRGF